MASPDMTVQIAAAIGKGSDCIVAEGDMRWTCKDIPGINVVAIIGAVGKSVWAVAIDIVNSR